MALELRANNGIVTLTGKIVAFGLVRDETEGAIVRVDKSTGRKLPRAPGCSPSSHVGLFPVTILRGA